MVKRWEIAGFGRYAAYADKVDRRLIGASPLIGATIGATAPSAPTIGAIGAIGASQPDRRQASFLLVFPMVSACVH